MISFDWITLLDDGLEEYFEKILNGLSQEFYDTNYHWLEFEKTFDKWVSKLHEKGIEYSDAIKIIERTHKLYKL